MLLLHSSGHLLSVSLIRDSKILILLCQAMFFPIVLQKKILIFVFAMLNIILKIKKLTNHSSFKV